MGKSSFIKTAILIAISSIIISCKENTESKVYDPVPDKALTKELYKQQVLLYCINKGIVLDYVIIDSMYLKAEPEVQQYINTIKIK